MVRAFYDLRLKICYFCPLAYKNNFYGQCPNKYLLQQVTGCLTFSNTWGSCGISEAASSARVGKQLGDKIGFISSWVRIELLVGFMSLYHFMQPEPSSFPGRV